MQWRIQLLGGLQAEGNGRVITHLATQKVGLLLAFLAYHRARRHTREQLTELLWPEGDLDAARVNFRKALSLLRQTLEPRGVPPGTVLLTDRLSVQLNPAAIATDVAEFDVGLRAAEREPSGVERVAALARAIGSYGGELLLGYYDDWILPEREWLAERYLTAIEQLARLLEESGDLSRALEYARLAVKADPLREASHRNLMRLLTRTGQPTAALQQYEQLDRLLDHELGTDPEPDTQALARQLTAAVDQAASGKGRGQTEDDRPPTTDHGRPTTGGSGPPEGERLVTDHERPVAASEPSPVVGGRSSTVGRRPSPPRAEAYEPVGGAVPLGSAFYIVRPTDAEFHAAIARGDSIVLVKGARQMGKTSLLARGLQQAGEAGARVIRTDLQMLDAEVLESVDAFFRALAWWIADEMEMEATPDQVWRPELGASVNFARYVRNEVLRGRAEPVVWGLDEVDRLLTCRFGSQVFGLFRSWHNQRALDPAGPWSRLTLAIAYATEAHLLISDMNQSPFNVGTRLTLDDFTPEQVAELNRRYGSPLRDADELARFFELVRGHPYLVRRGLHAMASRALDLESLEAEADQEEGIFGDHLRRLLDLLLRQPDLCDAVRAVLRHQPCPTEASFYHLRSSGLLAGDTAARARPRCRLYATFLARHLL